MFENYGDKAEILNRIFEWSKTPCCEEIAQKLSLYCELLLAANKEFNLTAITEEKEVFLLHFLDCAMGAPFIPLGANVCDVGSGAGFPGLLLALLRPDLDVVLIDSLNKRVRFLMQTAERLDVKCKCLHMRAEDITPEMRENFDVATARAVAPLRVLSEYTLPYVKVGGFLLAYKGRSAREELDESKKAFAILGATQPKLTEYKLEEYSRAIITVGKTTPSPRKYPRSGNKPRNSPL